jgi:hypothetical protein
MKDRRERSIIVAFDRKLAKSKFKKNVTGAQKKSIIVSHSPSQ